MGEQTALEEYIEQYVIHVRAEKGASEHTVESYARDLRRYARVLQARGIVDATSIRTADVRFFMRELADPTIPMPVRLSAAEAEESLTELIMSSSMGRAPKRNAQAPESAQPASPTDNAESLDALKELPPALGANSIARAMASVRGAHAFWFETRMLEQDVAAPVKPPKLTKRLPKAVSVEDIQRLLAVPNTETPAGLRERAMLEFLYATGARVSEMLGADIDDIHLGKTTVDDHGQSVSLPGYVRLFGKGSKERLVPLGSYAQRAIEEYMVRARPSFVAHGAGTSALFVNARGQRLSRQTAWTMLKEAAAEAGLGQEFSPHSMRHSFATHLLQGGADIRVVQELLGHASIATTQIYTKVTQDAMAEVYRSAHPRAHYRAG
ncbi:MAG: site-specific tyrosine recombinase XerD [Rothia sp. (in: high G+C Gram-positive bacteria)]|uniref:site-specific tyrosine recombinase XerD n=1 Tax=Rothia sp. (in: high G+C Gram-positive bacteria) TaxID=1885016 RepID=UPI0026DEE3FA|nr:site-specific tyrosine recombinase XerD [Rothia sp. (in: high G+C Gram-positive bacteria)]MDO5751014.1 site-specific tyrosine recombinase XerD [Rothia sp. (in: high G+C Gram-positive bacteria)]